MSFKRAKVVMFSTNKKAEIISIQYGLSKALVLANKPTPIKPYAKDETFEHLYLTSDDEIKESDWYENNRVIFRADDKFDKGNNPNQNKKNKKLIATTDSSLIIGVPQFIKGYLPQPSQEFIDKFIQEYNKGNIITDVLVEYEWNKTGQKLREIDIFDNILKINPKDNTITIRKVKDTWDRNEVITLIKEFRNCIINVTDSQIDYTNKWIEENL